MALQHFRSSTANKRPNPASMADGQIALNTATASPGLFYKDSAGNLVKAGPVHVGSTAPNVSPASGGTAGNSTGESWLDTSGSNPLLKVWNGSSWQTVQPVASGTVVSTADTGSVTSTMIVDGTIVNGDINASAAIAGTKISPDFGGQTVTTTGVISAAAGAAGTPSIAFTGDLNTGIYSPGTDQVAISTNSTQRLLIDASGNVNVKGTLRLSGSTSGYVGLAPAAVAGSVTYTLPSDAGSNGSFLVTDGTGGLSWDPLYIPPPSALITSNATAEVVDAGGSSGYFAFTADASERFRIDTAGRVLVGTSNPYSVNNGSIDASVQVVSAYETKSAISVINTGDTIYGPTLALVKRRNNVNNAPALPGDNVGNITFFAETGEYSRPAASIGAVAEGNYTIPAASMVAFQDYYIASVGTTNFTLYGATSNTPGTLFTCMSIGPYSGTGTVIAVNLSGNFISSRLVFTTTDPSQYNEIERMRITNDGVFCYRQTGVAPKSGAATLAVSELKNGIIHYTGAAATLTLPTGTLTEGGFFGIYTNMTFEWSVINTGTGTCTIGTSTGHTISGAATITAGASGRFASRRSAANTFVSYRLS